MKSFMLRAVGNLAANPELLSNKERDLVYTRFALIGNDYAGKDEQGEAREVKSVVWFVAFGALGEALARNAVVGDQLILEAHLRADDWTDAGGQQQHDYSFIVDGFRFGQPGRAKREAFAQQNNRVTRSDP